MMINVIGSLSTLSLVCACGAPPMMTVTVYEGQNQIVRLQTMPDANGDKGFSHPAFLSEQTLAAVLTGLVVEEDTSPIPLAFQRSGNIHRSPAFSEAEVKFLAPLLVKGLGMATPEELVTFFETADVSSTQRVVTSGGIFVIGNELHVLLGNHVTKVDIWQDSEEYEAPYRLRPLEPIHPEPARLVFEPASHMVGLRGTPRGVSLGGSRLHAAVRYKDLSTSAESSQP